MKINDIGISIESHRTAQANIDFHQQVVNENLRDLPCTTVHSLTALNVVLQKVKQVGTKGSTNKYLST